MQEIQDGAGGSTISQELTSLKNETADRELYEGDISTTIDILDTVVVINDDRQGVLPQTEVDVSITLNSIHVNSTSPNILTSVF